MSAGLPAPALVVLTSPFRFVVRPIVEYILTLETDHPERTVAVLVPGIGREPLLLQSAPQ